MRIESLSHLADSTVDQQLSNLVATDRGTTARMLHHIAECHRPRGQLAEPNSPFGWSNHPPRL